MAHVRERLLGEGYPRLTTAIILSASGGCAFLFSALALAAGLESMGWRYLLAALVGYLAFALFVRAWIAYRRGWGGPDFDIPDIDLPSGVRSASEPKLFFGGRSGGSGGGAVWDQPASGSNTVPLARGSVAESSIKTSGRLGGALDLDDFWYLVLAAACALAGLTAMIVVVYSAPVLLAEVALDAGLVSTVYRRLHRRDVRHWTGSLLARTWLPAAVVVASVAVAGFALQRAVPDARSIGAVFRAIGS